MPRGFEHLAETAVVIEMLVREDHHVDRRVVEFQGIEVTPECGRIGTTIDDHSTRSVPDVGGVPLPNVEQTDDQLSSTRVGDEAGYRRFERFACDAALVRRSSGMPRPLLLRVDQIGQRYQCQKKEDCASKHRYRLARESMISSKLADQFVVELAISGHASSLLQLVGRLS